MIIPTSLSLAYSGVCWEHHTRTLSKQFSNNIFAGVISFSEKCEDYLYSPSNNTVGQISLTELVKSFTDVMKESYTGLSDSVKKLLPNEADSIRYSETEKNYLGGLSERVSKLDAMTTNYQLISQSFGDEMKIYNHSLVGLNKKCFAENEGYKNVWKFGTTQKMLGLEEYEVASNTSRLLKGAVNEREAGKKELERKLAEESSNPNDNILENWNTQRVSEENQNDATDNTNPIKSQKIFNNPELFKTTNQKVTKLSEMQKIASLSISNMYKVESGAKKITTAILAGSICLLFLLAVSEYSHRTEIRNTGTKICMTILFVILGIGLLICLILLIIIHSDVSRVLSNLKQNRCIDLELVELLEKDLYISGHEFGVIGAFVLMVLGVLLGLVCSCGLWGRKHGYSRGRNGAPRFR